MIAVAAQAAAHEARELTVKEVISDVAYNVRSLGGSRLMEAIEASPALNLRGMADPKDGWAEMIDTRTGTVYQIGASLRTFNRLRLANGTERKLWPWLRQRSGLPPRTFYVVMARAAGLMEADDLADTYAADCKRDLARLRMIEKTADSIAPGIFATHDEYDRYIHHLQNIPSLIEQAERRFADAKARPKQFECLTAEISAAKAAEAAAKPPEWSEHGGPAPDGWTPPANDRRWTRLELNDTDGDDSPPPPPGKTNHREEKNVNDPAIFSRVKESLSLTGIITSLTGLRMQRNHLEACPFCGGHDCFSIQESNGRYHCFQCPAHGDVFEFIGRHLGLSKADALHEAARMAGIELDRIAPAPEKKPVKTMTTETNEATMTTNIIPLVKKHSNAMTFCTAADVFNSAKVPDPIVTGLGLEAGELAIISAQGGVGKSLFSLYLALHLAQPQPPAGGENIIFDKFTIPKQRNTLFLQSENSIIATKTRLRAICSGSPDLKPCLSRLFFLAIDDGSGADDIRVSGSMTDPAFIQSIQEQTQSIIRHTGHHIDVIVIDPLVSYYGDANENFANEMRRIMDTFVTLGRQTGATPILLHHEGKTVQNLRGSSAIRDAARSCIRLSSTGLTATGLQTIKVECEKSNNSKPFDAFTLSINADLTLSSVNPVATRTALDRLDDVKAIMEALGHQARQSEVMTALQERGISKTRAHHWVKLAIEEGIIELKPIILIGTNRPVEMLISKQSNLFEK